MKVKILKTPSYQEGGIYGHGYSLSPAEAFSLLPSGYRNVGELLKSGKNLLKNTPKNKTSQPNIPQQTTNPMGNLPNVNEPINATGTPGLESMGSTMSDISPELLTTGSLSDIAPMIALKKGGWIQKAVNPAHKGYCTPMTKSTCTPRRKALARTFKKHHGFHQDGGETIDPQLLQAYQTIANQLLEEGQDPNALIDEYVHNGMSYDDAQEIISQVMDFINPTSESEMPTAQIGGGVFAGQTTQPSNIIAKPVMKDGGQTFVTSQPAYTQKSHNYFGTSNAPARDSYTNNQEVTTSVKAVPEEDATIEAEKGEYIFSDKGLYKILGKKHSEGGTPLSAKGGEFIFSAHKDMSLDPELQTEAGLKKPSSKALSENTPAKILERNIDVKEYNRLKVIASDPKSDKVTKKTALFMLDKFDQKIQTIAQLQEAKKQPNPPQIQDQYLEQPQVQQDINEQKQYQDGGNIPVYQSGTANVDVNKIYDNQVPFNQGNIIGTNIGNEIEHPQGIDQFGVHKQFTDQEVNDFINKHQWFFKPKGITSRSQLTPQIIGEFQKAYNPLYLNETGQNYFNIPGKPTTNVDNALGKWTINAPLFNYTNVVTDKVGDTETNPMLDRPAIMTTIFKGNIPNISEQTQTNQPPGNKDDNKKISDDKKTSETPDYPIIGNDYDVENPYNEIRGMEYAKYMNNLISNKPYFTYASPVNTPRTVFRQMSRQPLLDEAARARYSVNQLASKFGDKNQRMLAAAQQNDAVNKGLYNIEKYNTEGITNNYNQNALRNSASLNTWNDRLKQAYDQNQNVLDKVNYANAAYYNQYMTAQEKDMLDKYYAEKDLQTALLPYASTYDVKDKQGNVLGRRIAYPVNPNGSTNPNWRGWNTKAVEQMAQKQDSIEQRVLELKSKGLSDKTIEMILDKEFPDLKQSSK